MGHDHGHGSGAHRWRLAAAFGLVATFFLVEVVAGVVTGSLALLSDAGHMAADVVALGAALVATKVATRQDATGRRTYGSYRAEVLASGFTVLLMLGVSLYVVVEALSRLGDPVGVAPGPMLVVGLLGLLVNVVCLALLRGGAEDSLNVKGAYLEVLADAAGSVGVVVAGGLVAVTGDQGWDTGVAFAIGAFVAVRALLLGREVLAVLAQHVPRSMDLDTVIADLEDVPGVDDVHDFHAWTLTSGMNVATAHLVVRSAQDSQAVLARARTVLRVHHDVQHATLQVEDSKSRDCHETTW